MALVVTLGVTTLAAIAFGLATLGPAVLFGLVALGVACVGVESLARGAFRPRR